MPNHPSHYQDHTFLFLPQLTDPQTAETIPPAASKSSTPLETLFHTIMSDGAKVFDPMARLCAAVALPAPASDGLLVINTRLPRNPHLLAQQMPRYLWRTAEADLYFAQDDAGRWRELFAAISSADALTNDAEPINPRTPLAATWRQTATRMGAPPDAGASPTNRTSLPLCGNAAASYADSTAKTPPPLTRPSATSPAGTPNSATKCCASPVSAPAEGIAKRTAGPTTPKPNAGPAPAPTSPHRHNHTAYGQHTRRLPAGNGIRHQPHAKRRPPDAG